MKKIVTIMTVAAMATSLFAVDISAAIKFNGSLFNMTFVDGAKPTALTLEQPKAQKGHGQTGIDLNVSTDKAGASLILGNGYSGAAGVNYEGFKMWIKPADAVKINFGELDYCLNKESIDYAGCINGAAGKGFALDVNAGAISANVVLPVGYNTAWLNGDKVGTTAAYVKYGADFGTIGLAYLGEDAMKKHTMSLGYSGTFGDVSLFTDAAFVMADKQNNVKADLFVNAKADAFGCVAYADMDFDVTGSKVASIGAKAKLTYALDGCTPYLYIKDPNVMADKFQLEVKPGVNFNIGAAGVEVAVDVQNCFDKDNNKNCDWKLSVPFGVTLGF